VGCRCRAHFGVPERGTIQLYFCHYTTLFLLNTPAFDEVKQHHDKIIAEALKKGSYGMKLVGRAAQSASAFAESDGLHPAIIATGDSRVFAQPVSAGKTLRRRYS
jgi:hypothetical protein